MKVTVSGRALLIGLVLVVGAAVGGIAYATIPDSAGAIHACYSPNGAEQKNGTQLNIVDSDAASCGKNQAEVTWNQTGPPGADGVDGAKGDKGDKGDPGPSASYTNYGDGFHSIAEDDTQTVASVTLPPGSYILSGAAQAIGVDDFEFAQCFFAVPGVTVNGRFAVFVRDGSEPMLADFTIATNNSARLRCTARDGTILLAGQMIATQVGTVTASE